MTPLGEETKKASLVICHGFGEHHEVYINFAIQFVLNGFEVHMADFTGFGYSGGTRFDLSFSQLQYDLVTVLKKVDPKLPLFLLGHSMGGCVTTSFLENN